MLLEPESIMEFAYHFPVHNRVEIRGGSFPFTEMHIYTVQHQFDYKQRGSYLRSRSYSSKLEYPPESIFFSSGLT